MGSLLGTYLVLASCPGI